MVQKEEMWQGVLPLQDNTYHFILVGLSHLIFFSCDLQSDKQNTQMPAESNI